MTFSMPSPVERQESFVATRKIAKTPTSKSLTLSVKWPHPKSYKANPLTLADAGFYWNPNSTAKDNVTCFCCKEDFSDWELQHDPHVIHYDRCGEYCSWAIARCGIFAVDSDSNLNFKLGNDPNRLPCSKFLEKHRYTIFVHGDWPHDKAKGHTVTSRRMAGAGFLFTPHEPGDDTAKCPYCGIELSGWEPHDDPVEEHRRRNVKRGADCPFFTAKVTALPDKKTVRKTMSKASLQTQKPARSRSAKTIDPGPDSDDQEENLGRSTRSRTTKATKTPARGAAASRSRATPSIVETDEPSESDIAQVTKPKAKGSKRKAKDETPIAELEDESEAAANPPRKSTRAKKTRGVFEDIEVDVNFEESKQRQAQSRRSTRSRSKVPEGSGSDTSVKSVRSTRSTRSTKSAKGASKSKKTAKPQPVVEEEEEEEMATPIQALKKSTRSTVPPKSTKGRKPARGQSVDSESSGLLPTPPPKPPKSARKRVIESESEDWESAQPPKSTRKSRKRVIESGSEDWESAQEDVAPTPRPSTTKKARGRPKNVTKTSQAPQEPVPAPPSPTPSSDWSHIPGSYMSESEVHTPVRDDSSKVTKTTIKQTTQPFHAKPSNQDRAPGGSRTKPLASSRLLSIGLKENVNNRNPVVIDNSDDEDDTRRLVTSRTTPNSTKVINSPINVVPQPKTTLAQKRESFVGVVLEPSPRIKSQLAKTRVEGHEVDMYVDEVTVLDQPSRSAETDHDSPVAAGKGKAKAALVVTKQLSTTSKQKQKADVQSEASDSAMDVDEREHETQEVQSIRDSRQPSTPRRDLPRRIFSDDSNPFAPVLPQPGDANPLPAFDVPYGKVPAEVIHALGEEEKEMTVEEWTKRELEIQVELLKEHGLRKIREFKERAAEVRRQIEAL